MSCQLHCDVENLEELAVHQLNLSHFITNVKVNLKILKLEGALRELSPHLCFRRLTEKPPKNRRASKPKCSNSENKFLWQR